MNPLNPDCPLNCLSRAGGNPARTTSPRSWQNVCSAPLRRVFFINWIPACAGMTQHRPIGLSVFFAAFLLACIPAASADTLGRLFFTPEQRMHLDYEYARNAPTEGGSSPFVTVNGIVQKTGGARTVWVNGVAQSADSGERTTGSQSVTIPGKSRPIRLKVGDKILLDQAPPGSQNAAGE